MAFFEDLGKKISDAGQDIALQSKNKSELNRLNNISKDINAEISGLYAAIGCVYYERHKDDADAEEAVNIQKINELFDELERVNSEIKKLKGYRNCPNCDAEVGPDAMFCASCGTNVPPAQMNEPQNMSQGAVSFCPNCGNAIAPGNMFCNNCGTKVG